MPQLTNIEETLLNDLHAQAESLENGKKGDAETMSSVVAKTAKVVVAMARTGGVSPQECSDHRAYCVSEIKRTVEESIGKSDWKAKLAVWVPMSGALFGLGLKVFSL